VDHTEQGNTSHGATGGTDELAVSLSQRPLRYLSLFSGIEAATAAWHELGWTPVAFADIEPFPNAVTKTHYAEVPNLGDVTKITEQQIRALGRIDLIVFGSPCQDLSVAGKRAGLQGERSGLFHDAIRIIRWARVHCSARFALWENVPGAFSSNKGADFAIVVGELAGCTVTVPPRGWGNEGALVGPEALVEWSTLDAQWFRVAQRRRRVFAFADFGDWSRRPPVLLEPEGLRGDSAPSRQAGEGIASTLARSAGHHGRSSPRGDGRDNLVAVGGSAGVTQIAPPRCEVPQRRAQRTDRLGNGDVRDDVAPTLETTCNDYSRADGFVMIVEHG